MFDAVMRPGNRAPYTAERLLMCLRSQDKTGDHRDSEVSIAFLLQNDGRQTCTRMSEIYGINSVHRSCRPWSLRTPIGTMREQRDA